MTPALSESLWSRRDRLWLLVPLIGGATLIALAWFLAAGRADAGAQLAPVSLAIAGAGLGFAAALVWLGRGRRAVRTMSWLLLGAADDSAPPTPVATELLAASPARFFHRGDCLLITERALPVASRTAHERAGRRPCPACRP